MTEVHTRPIKRAVETLSIVAGNPVSASVSCEAPDGFEWDGITVTAHVREYPGAPLACASSITDLATDGNLMSFTWSLTADQTVLFADTMQVDFRIYRDGFGPYNSESMLILVGSRITLDVTDTPPVVEDGSEIQLKASDGSIRSLTIVIVNGEPTLRIT